MTQFKQQFQQLLRTQPRFNLKQVNVVNCAYADTVVKSGNCYYTFGAFYCDNVMFGRYSRRCVDCCDITLCVGCEACYQCIDCVNCFFTNWSQYCQNCTSCSYCFECFGCSDCFGCVGLYRKKECLFNKHLSAAEYQRAVAKFNLSDSATRRTIETNVAALRRTVPNLNWHQFRCDNSIGENLSACSNCYQCYDAFALENCLYCIENNGNKDCCDITVCFESELCYQCVQSPLNYNCNYLFQVDQSMDSEFCAYSKNLKNCFGCVGLANKEYHILNKPYSPTDYANKVAQLRAELIAQHEYSLLLFFASPYESQRYSNETDSVIQANLANHLAKDFSMITTKNIVTCLSQECGKQFKIIDQEEQFYTSKKLPPPEFCPACRHRQRMALRSERALYQRVCGRCQQPMLSVYPSSAPYTIYCQKCYWENVG